MTVKEEIMEAITRFPGMTDAELAKRYKRIHQTINSACRELASKGFLTRQPNPDKNGNLGNYPTGKAPDIKSPKEPVAGDELDEDAVKACIKDWLENQGWSVRVAWGKKHGVDIEAVKENERWLIEAKGPGSRQAMRHNYFIGILGETLQRMDCENAKYSIAFPDMPVYRGLWDRLPSLAKRRTGIDMILVSKDKTVTVLK